MSTRKSTGKLAFARSTQGFTLVELMVALVIGLILILGATQVFVQSQGTYAISESQARLQETARYALSVMEPDIRMANYWGLKNWPIGIVGSEQQSNPSVGGPDECGTNFAIDVFQSVQGSNNTFLLGAGATSACDPYGTGAVAAADTLTIRHASATTAAAVNNQLQLCSTRVAADIRSNGVACDAAAPVGLRSNLLVNSYYISRDSTHAAGLPSLRRKRLIAGPAFSDEEIIPGIEDLQVQFGIDTTGNTGVAQRYVNPDSVPAGAQVVAVKIWLLVRSESPEPGFRDDKVYEYGDRLAANTTTFDLNDAGDAGKAFAPNATADTSPTSIRNYRRLLVSKTIHLRNAVGL